MKTPTHFTSPLLSFVLTCFLLTAGFTFSIHAQGKKVLVGNGTGFLDYPNAQTTLNLHDDDTVLIKAGTYTSISFKNITASAGHKIYIMNGGLVEITDPYISPIPSAFSNLVNVEIRGDGVAGIDFGFYIHNVLKGITLDGYASGVTFSYIRMENMGDYSIFVNNPSLKYDGTNNTNSLFYNIKFLHFSVANIKATFLQVGLYTRLVDDGLANMTRNLEFAYSTITNSVYQDLLHLDKVVNANVHHNKFTHLNTNDEAHSGIIYLYGSGDVHHNIISDYWGSGIRAHAFNLDVPGVVNVYNNIMVSSRKYSAVEAQTTPEDMNVSFIHYCNYKVYNNTFGNLDAADWQAAMVDTYDAVGGTIEIKNNLGFNIERDKPFNPTQNYIYNRLNVTIPDTSNNLYRKNFADVGLADDVNCMLAGNSPAIDKGLTLPMVTDDLDGISRPQSAAYDIGAREFASGVVYPVARAGADTSTILPKDSVMLSGAASYNPGGGALTYKWLQLAGPSTAVIRTDVSATPVFKSLLQGTYRIKLTVTNTQGNSSNDTVVIVVSPVAVFPPVAKAGGTTTITLPVNSTGLSGAASVSNGGGTLKYAWSKVAGPASFVISSDTAVAPFISSLTEGTYKIKLTVTDTNHLTAIDTATVIVKPVLVPVADAGADVNLILPANSTALNGAASANPGGGTLTYAWTKASGPASFSITGNATATPTVSNLTEGTYQVKLTVTNSAGVTSSDFVNIIVTAAPVAIANAGTDINLTLPVNTATLNGSTSSTTGGGVLTYAWSLVSGPVSFTITGAATATPVISNLTEGVYQVKLKVTNTQGSSAEDIVAVTVSAQVVYVPISNAGPDIKITLPTSSTVLNGEQSYSPGGGALTYAWSKISGPASFTLTGAATATPVLSNLTEGAYQVQLKITNAQGSSSEDTVTVTVSPAPAVPPVANAGVDISITLPVSTATLNGTGSSNAAGGTLVYAWTKVSGPTSFTITGAATSNPVIGSLTQGVYQVKLSVTNAQGLSAEDIVAINVNAAALPVANAGNDDVSLVLPANSITLNAGASYDPSGGALNYSWTKVSGPDAFTITGGSTVNPTISNLSMGSYQVQLTVTNATGGAATDMVNISVTTALLSVPDAGKDTTVNFPDGYAILDGTHSYGTGGATITHYHWQQISGTTTAFIQNPETPKTTATNLEPGVYIFQLSVTDSYGQTKSTTFKVTVQNSMRNLKSIKLYPNPAAERLNVHVVSDSTGTIILRVTDMLGVVKLQQTFQKTQLLFDQPLDVSRLAGGMYTLEVIDGKEVQLHGKFIKR